MFECSNYRLLGPVLRHCSMHILHVLVTRHCIMYIYSIYRLVLRHCSMHRLQKIRNCQYVKITRACNQALKQVQITWSCNEALIFTDYMGCNWALLFVLITYACKALQYLQICKYTLIFISCVCVFYYACILQSFEVQGRCFTNFHYFYYYL